MKREFLKKSLALSISFAMILNLLLLKSSVWANDLPNANAGSSNKKTTNPGARQDFSLATVEGEKESSSNIYYIHTDHLGGIHVVSDQNGRQVELNDYYPFGDLRINASILNEQRKFTGHEFDPATNLTYANTRYYNQNSGRWLNQDPRARKTPSQFLTDPQQLNSYAYGRNNPLKFIDPTGEANSEFQPFTLGGAAAYFGEQLGVYRGLPLRSAGDRTGRGSHAYQCVSWGKTFAQSQYGVNLDYTGHAYAYAEQSSLNRSFRANNAGNPGQYTAYSNGGTVIPQENDLIAWSGGREGVGHVGVVSEVVFDTNSGTGYVYTVEQNAARNQAIFSQPLYRIYNGRGQAVYIVQNRLGNDYSLEGWSRYENESRLPGLESYTSTQHTPATKVPIERP